MSNSVLYDFEGFRVDTEQRCLMRGEEFVSLTPKAFETLLVLVENRGKVLTKNALLDHVWKDTFVEESTLAQNISTLRKTFAKYDISNDVIVTIPRLGYRFVADVTETAAEEEILHVQKRSVTHIVAEQEQINDTKGFALSGKWLIAIPVTFALVVAGLLGNAYLNIEETQFDTKFSQFRTTPLFSGERIGQTAISPDGTYIAFIESKSGGNTLFLRQIADGNSVKLVDENDLSISGIVFSPENDGIYYSAYKQSEPFPKYGNLYKVPLLGGVSRLVMKDIDGPVSFSPDSKKIAFVRGILDSRESVLMTANLDGSDEKRVASRELRNGYSMSGLSWSPDGKTIAITITDRMDRESPMKLIVVNYETGESRALTDSKWLWIGRARWLKDGSGIVVVAYGSESPNLTDEIWFISYPEGKARSITRGLSGITGVGITDDGETMIAGRNNRLTTRSYFSFDNPDNSNVISKTVSGDSTLSLGAGWVGKDRIVFSESQNENTDIWSMDVDGSNRKQLTSHKAADYDPVVAPDGRHVYFRSNRKGSMTLWRMGIDGSNHVEIVDDYYASKPSFSSDGSDMYFSSLSGKHNYSVLWKSDPHGKNRKQLTDYRAMYPKISPDGKFLLCFAVEDGKETDALTPIIRLTLFSLKEDKIVKQFERLDREYFTQFVWKRDSSGFYALIKHDGKSELRERSLAGENLSTIKRWDQGKVFQMALSDSGNRLFFEKGEDVISVLKFTNKDSR
jgi:Tol biopolymer transport system component/DNA-binding winged helix-turn-helix (wHTH) protein